MPYNKNFAVFEVLASYMYIHMYSSPSVVLYLVFITFLHLSLISLMIFFAYQIKRVKDADEVPMVCKYC